MPKHFCCVQCLKRCRSDPSSRRPVPPYLKEKTEKKLHRPLTEGDVLCSACRRRMARSDPLVLQGNNSQHMSNSEETDDPEFCHNLEKTSKALKSPKSVELKICSTPRNHKNCVLCKKPSGHRNHLTVVPSSAITQAFVHVGIFINSDSRCCKFHLVNGYFTQESVLLLNSTKSSETLSRTEIGYMLDNVRTLMKTMSHLNFDVPTALQDSDYQNLTGLSRDQFHELTSYIHSLRNNNNRSIKTCVAVFLTKLRTGLPNSLLSSIFGLSETQVQRIIPSVKEELMDTFVPKHLGFQHISHQEFCDKHTTPVARTLFTKAEDEAVLLLDGTYIFIQKSGDYYFQRRSYSLHKNRPLVKPMMVVGSDGYILSVLGPYMADYSNNDASIIKHMMNNNSEDMKDWLKEDDVMVVDRGFRDAMEFLKESGLRVEMPSYLQKGAKQHTTEEANLSRLVTKVRWVVESANGRIKQWRLLDKVVPNTLVPQIGDFIRIICAMCNKFRPPLASMEPESEELAIQMLERVTLPNAVKELVEEHNLLKRRTPYQKVNSADEILSDFPRISMEDLRSITMGVYQIKQCISYSKEHVDDEGIYDLMICKDIPNLLQVKIQSRHSKNSQHTLWIKYSLEDTSTHCSVSGWYCTCKVGARVVGCCAHVASVLWYIGYQRHQEGVLAQEKQSKLVQAVDDAGENIEE